MSSTSEEENKWYLLLTIIISIPIFLLCYNVMYRADTPYGAFYATVNAQSNTPYITYDASRGNIAYVQVGNDGGYLVKTGDKYNFHNKPDNGQVRILHIGKTSVRLWVKLKPSETQRIIATVFIMFIVSILSMFGAAIALTSFVKILDFIRR